MGEEAEETVVFAEATAAEKWRWDAIMDDKFNLGSWITTSDDLVVKLAADEIG